MQQAIESKISDAEWEIMRVIWTNQPVTSRFISNVLMEKMSWKAATIKTLIGRLVDKGVVSTEQEGNKYLYSAIQTEEESIQSMTSAVLNHICSTKVGHVLANLMDEVVPVNHIATLYNYTKVLEEESGLKLIRFGHAGDGNLHTCITRGDIQSQAVWEEKRDFVLKKIYQKIHELGGLPSAEHGIGVIKKTYSIK